MKLMFIFISWLWLALHSLIRMLPLALAKKEITNPFIKSFLFYVPMPVLQL